MLLEAPVSWNMRYIRSQGNDCHLTHRGVNLAEALTLADRLMGKTGEAGAQNGHGQENGNGHTKASGLAWCDIHGCVMMRYEKSGRS